MYEEECYGDEQAAAEEAAYQEMCEAGADFEQQQMEAEGEAYEAMMRAESAQMDEALEKGTINKSLSPTHAEIEDIRKCIDMERMINEDKKRWRNKQ